MKQFTFIFLLITFFSSHVLSMDLDEQRPLASSTSAGTLTPRTYGNRLLQKVIDETNRTDPEHKSPTRNAKRELLQEQQNNLKKPETEKNAFRFALLIRAAEKGEEKYIPLRYENSEIWASKTQLLKAARYWAYEAWPDENNLTSYDKAALLIRKNGDTNHHTRERIVENILQAWETLYDFEKKRTDRTIDNPALKEESTSPSNKEKPQPQRTNSQRLSLIKIRKGSNSPSGSSTPTTKSSPQSRD